MKIIDWYIIKKYLSTFVVMILLFIPIGVMVDMAEKIDKFKENEVPAEAILNYYLDFTWYFGNLLFPIFLFLAVIWFTSKLANNTEIIALLSSGISFSRFLRPYLISAGVIALFAFFSGMFIVPKSNSSFNEFHYKYINKKSERQTKNLFKQINPKEYIFVSSYDPIRKSANNFTLEHFEENQLTFKIQASSIRWVEKDSVFRLSAYSRRTFVDEREIYFRKSRLDTLFDFEIDDLAPVNYKAETLTFSPLNEFIEKEREGGSVMINSHLLVRHKRWTLPFSAFVLTLIGVSVSSFKRRGGMGVNLAFGISLGFLFIFFDKIFSVLVNKSNFSPLLGAWLPIIIFGGLAIFLLRRARR
ncbi:MAG: LptF/LptG family permease [Flavobacteriaceae bacterium]|jgi:lipopolysaccharide export system permease protein|nr:LptF/LptG family permease [Flavobacteriaceae bacterium]